MSCVRVKASELSQLCGRGPYKSLLWNNSIVMNEILNITSCHLCSVTTGYLACSVFLRDSNELGVLVVNTIRRVSLFIYLVLDMLLIARSCFSFRILIGHDCYHAVMLGFLKIGCANLFLSKK